MDLSFNDFLRLLLILMVTALAISSLLLGFLYQKLKKLELPADADFLTTLRAVPISLVIALDLLDLGLDVLAAPVVWALLSRFRLQGLRQVATIEALFPFSQPIPTLTMAWLFARFTNRRS